MGTIAQKLQNIVDSKAAISAAIEAKGGTVPTELTGYGAAIEALPSGGGSSDLANKLIDRSITEVTAADLSGVTTVGRRSFAYCAQLTSVVIPDNITNLAEEVFTYDGALTYVTLPNSIDLLKKGVFSYCSCIVDIDVPDSVHYIMSDALRGCTALSSVIWRYNGGTGPGTFGGQIGAQAFRDCSNCLIFDFSHAINPYVLENVNAFQGTNANKKIIVPDALYDEWKARTNWNSTTNGIVDAITKASEA